MIYLQWVWSPGGAIQTLNFELAVSEDHDASADVTDHPVERGINISDNVRRTPDKVTIEAFFSNVPISAIGPDGNTRGAVLPSPLSIPLPAIGDGAFPPQNAPDVRRLPFPLSVSGETVTVPRIVTIGGARPPLLQQGLVAKVLQFQTTFDDVRDVYETLRDIQTGQKTNTGSNVNDVQIGAQNNPPPLVTLYTPKFTYYNMTIVKIGLKRAAEDGIGGSFSLDFREIRVVNTKIVAAPKSTIQNSGPSVSKGAQSVTGFVGPQQKESVNYRLAHGGKS